MGDLTDMVKFPRHLLDKLRFWHYLINLLNKIQYRGGWTFAVDKSFILDPNISVGAKAVYLALKSFCAPGNPTAFPSGESLCENLAISRNTLNKYVREVKGAGLLSRRQDHSGQRFGPIIYTLYAHDPQQRNLCAAPNLCTKEVPGGREEKPGKETNKEKKAAAEEIFKAYPSCRRVSKPKTLDYILRAFEKFSPAFVLERTKMFAAAREGEEKRFTPMSTTWFNQERFNDDPSTWGNGKTEAHAEGDPAGELQGKKVRWTKIGGKWIKASA